MPGNVQNSVASTVLPWKLCSLFSHSRRYEVEQTVYPDGSREAQAVSTSSIKQWQLSQRLTESEFDALWTFFVARKYGAEAFYFYDVHDTVGFAYDATGVSSTGRYKVRFIGGIAGQTAFQLTEASFTLEEVQ